MTRKKKLGNQNPTQSVILKYVKKNSKDKKVKNKKPLTGKLKVLNTKSQNINMKKITIFYLKVTWLGFEPRTHTLKVYCSTS